MRNCWRTEPDRWDITLVLLILVWLSVFLTLSVLQFETGHDRSFDLALYARSLWGIAHGEPINSLRDQHVLALHGHFVLYPIAPLAKLVSSVYLLLILQSVAIASGAAVSYAIAVQRLGTKPAALAVALIYLAYPLVSNTLLFDMHVKTLATPFLLVAIDRLDRSGLRDWRTWVVLLIAFSCREEISLAVGVMGLGWLVIREKRKVGVALAITGCALFAAYYFIVQPSFGSDAASIRAHFGHLRETGLLRQLVTEQNIALVLGLLGSLAFLPVVGWRFSVGAIVPVAIAMLSQWPGATHPTSHYPFLAVPFLIMGTIEGLSIMGKKSHRVQRWAIVFGIVCSLVSYRLYSVGPGGRNFEAERYASTPLASEAMRCVALVPDDVPALAPDHLVAHIAERKIVTTSLRSPMLADQLRSALLDVDSIPTISGFPGYAGYLASRRAAADHLQADLGFSEVARCGPYLLLAKD